MNRRKFILNSSVLSASLMLPKFISCSPNTLTAENTRGRKVIVIQLAGGNDGLNTFIPYRNDIYYKSRPYLAIAKNEAFKLSDDIGLHPNMEEIKQLFDDGYISVINNVGYPNPSRSHFRSMDIWQSASNSDQYLESGWIGRYLDSECPDHCKSPLDAIEIADSLSLAMKGEKIKGMSFNNLKLLFNNANHTYLKALSNHSEKQQVGTDNALFLHKTLAETVQNTEYVYNKSKTYRTKVRYPQSYLSQQLKTIGQLIGAGSSTTVYYVSQGGYDTHAFQSKKHGRLLRMYSTSVNAFVQDLKNSGNFDNTIILTFSEFGRRVTQNASRGTDHGTASNVTIIGGSLKKAGFVNDVPNLTDLDKGDLKHQIDFRQVYATVLSNWLGADSNKILGNKYKTLDFI